MADNILKGLIVLETKGVPEATNKTASALAKTEGALKATRTAGFAFNQVLREAPSFAFSFQTGLLGISNNLPILTDAFKRAREAGAGVGTIFKSLAASLFSLPSIISLGTLALIGLSGGSKKAKEDTEELNKAADEARRKQDEFKNALDRASGSVLSQAGNITELRNALISTNSQFEGLTKNIINQAVSQFLFDKKNVEVQKLLNAEIQNRLKLSEKLSPILTLPTFRDKSKNPFENQISDAKDQIRIINETAKSLGLTFSNILKPIKTDTISVKPEKIEVEPTIAIIDKLKVPVRDLTVDTSGAGLQRSTFIENFRRQNEAALEPIRKNLLELKALGEFVGNSIADGFTNAFKAIAKGENPIKSLGEAIKGLVVDLITAAIRAFIVQKIISLFAPGLGKASASVLSGFGGFRAGGGPVQAGRSYVVGENGPELFSPGINGSIIPNGSMGGFAGGGMAGRVVFEISGNKLIGVLANGNRSQNALI